MRDSAIRLVFFVIFFGLFYLAAEWFTPHDDSDPPNGRSGFTVYKDALTGCKYIGRGIFGVTFQPRMDASGRQVCRK